MLNFFIFFGKTDLLNNVDWFFDLQGFRKLFLPRCETVARRRGARTTFKNFVFIGSALLVSACVSAEPQFNLAASDTSQGALSNNQGSHSSGLVERTQADTAPQTNIIDGVGVPSRSPNAATANQTASTTSENASALAIAAETQTKPEQVLASVTTENTPSVVSASPASVTIDPSQTPAVDDGTVTNTDENGNTTQHASLQTGAIESAPAKRNYSVLERLLQGSGNNTRKKPARRAAGRGESEVRVASLRKPKRASTATASLSASSRSRTRAQSADTNPLPGVRSKNEIFGIAPDQGGTNSQNNTQLAAVGSLGRLSPNRLRLQHEKVQVACLKPGVLRLLQVVERHYGKKPIITSGYRSPKRNRRAGGARKSQHIFCKAVDIQVEGVSKWALAKYLRTIPGRGGVGTYCRTKSVHLDIGKKRDWHHPCRRSKVRKRKKA